MNSTPLTETADWGDLFVALAVAAGVSLVAALVLVGLGALLSASVKPKGGKR